jgi:type IV pilus assembly protein PilN
MTRINLLPWREKYIEFQNRRLAFFCAVAIMAGLLACLFLRMAGSLYLESINSDVQYLAAELAKSAAKMNQVSSLLSKKAGLLQRIKIIENLQINRNLSAQILDGVVKSLPNNITLVEITCRTGVVKLTGIAVTNGDISKYMTNLGANSWVAEAILSEIKLNEVNNDSFKDAAVNKATGMMKFVIEINLKAS